MRRLGLAFALLIATILPANAQAPETWIVIRQSTPAYNVDGNYVWSAGPGEWYRVLSMDVTEQWFWAYWEHATPTEAVWIASDERIELAIIQTVTAAPPPPASIVGQFPTPVPTARPPAATSIPVATGVRIVETADHRSATGSSGRIVGIVENTGPVAADLTISVSLLDASGRTIGANRPIYERPFLPPGERGPFYISLSGEELRATSYRTEVQAAPLSDYLRSVYDVQIEVIEHTTSSDRFGRKIAGRIRNNGSTAVSSAGVLAAVYNPSGQLLNVDNGYATLERLAPGASSPFEISLPAETFVRYELWPFGRRG